MVSKHSNESFWNWSEIFIWTSLVNTQKSEPESPGNMAMNVINFKVGFTKIKSRQQVHQNGRLQQINVQYAKPHYHIIYPLQFNTDCANVTVSQHSPLSRGSGLRDCSLFLTWIRIRQQQPRAFGAWGFIRITGSRGLAGGILGRKEVSLK